MPEPRFHSIVPRVMLSVGAAQILIMLVGLLRSKVLSAYLGPAGFGLVGSIDQIVLALTSVGALGLPFAALKFMARSHSEGEQSFHRAYSGFLWALASLGIATGAIGTAAALFVPRVFGPDLAAYGWLIAIAMVGVPAAMVNMLIANALAASQRGGRSAVFTLAIQAILLFATIVGVYAAGTAGLYGATVAAGALSTVAAVLMLRGMLGSPSRLGAGWLVSELKRNPSVLRYSIWVYVAAASYALAMSLVRTHVFTKSGPLEAGLLQAALSLALTLGAVINPMSNLLLTPLVNRSIPADAKFTAVNEFAARGLTLTLLAALPFLLFPKLALRLLFAADFLPAATFLFAFMIWQCVSQVANVYTHLLIGLDDVAFACVAFSFSYAIGVATLPFTVASFGVLGVAISLIAGASLGGIATIARLARKFNGSMEANVLVRLAFAVGAMSIVGWISASVSETTGNGLLLRLGMAMAVLVLHWLVSDPAEKRWIKSRVRRQTE